MNNKLYIPYEEEEQRVLVDWLERKGYMFTAIPNATYTPSWKQKLKNYATGLRPGLPDIVVVLPELGLLFIELKRKKGGSLTKPQKLWIETLNKLDGIEAIVSHGAEEAINYILSLEKNTTSP